MVKKQFNPQSWLYGLIVASYLLSRKLWAVQRVRLNVV